MSLTRKPGKPAASADVNPRKAHNAERENQEQLVSRRSSTAGKTLDQRAKLEHWREQKQLQERNKSAGKVMSTSSRRGKENSILVSTGIAGGSTRSSIQGGSTRPSTPVPSTAVANNVAPSRLSSSSPSTTGRLYAPKTRRASTATSTMVTAGRERPATTRSNFPGQKVQRAPAPATPPPSSAAPSKAGASRPSGLPRPSASPYKKTKDENCRATSLLQQSSESQVKRDAAGSRSLRQPSLARPRREPATATLDTKAGARGMGGGGKDKTVVETSSGTMPEGTDVRSQRRPCAGPVGGSGGGGSASASVWRWAGSQIRRRTPPRTLPPAESSATGERAPRPVASHTGPSTVEEDSCVTNKTAGETLVRGGSGNVADAPPAPSVVQETSVQKAKNMVEAEGDVADAPPAPSVVQETAVQKAKSGARAGEGPPSPRALIKADFRESERPAQARSAGSPFQREPKVDNLETTSSLPRRHATNGSIVVKKQSLASTVSTAKVAVPAFGTSGNLSKSSKASLELTTDAQASTKETTVQKAKNVAGAEGDVTDAPLAPSTVQETAVQRTKSVAGVGEEPPSPRVLIKAGFREGERPAQARNASSPCQREPKADKLETTSSLPRRRATNGSIVVKKQSLASTVSTVKVAVPAFGSSGSLSKSSETRLESTTGDQASKEAAVCTHGGILPETRPEEPSAAMNAAGARGSPVQKREGISRSNSFSLGALTLTPPGLRRCSRVPSLHAGSAGSRTDVSAPSAVSSLACGSSGKGLRQPRDTGRRERGGGSREDAVTAPAGKGPFSENGIEPTLASALLSPVPAPLDDGGNRSQIEVLSPVVDESDALRGGFRDSRSAASSKLDETDGVRTDAGRASPSSALPLPLSSLWAWSSPSKGSCGGQALPERNETSHKQQEGGGGEEQMEGNLCANLELARLSAGTFVEERRKDQVGPGVPGEPAVLSVASPGSDENARGWLTRSNSDGFTFESSSDEESSGSDKEDVHVQDGDGDRGGNERPPSQEKASGWTSFMESFGHPYSDGNVVIDPDLVQPSSSSSRSQSSSAGSARTSSASSANGEGRGTGQPSLASSATSASRSTAMVGASRGPVMSSEMTEIGVQTEATPDVAHAVVQVGEGRLLSEDELLEKATLEELRERLRMVSHDLEAEVFHREVVKQEQEQLRRKLVAQHEEEIERLRWIIKEKEVEHNNEKIRMRWEHAEELDAERSELEDGGAAKDKLEEFQNMRERERDFHAKELEAERERVREARAKLTDAERANREVARRVKKMEEMMRQLIEENEELRGFEEEDEAGDEKDAGDGEKEEEGGK